MLVIKLAKDHYFSLFTPSVLSIFKHNTCILHHFAFLVWLPARIFSPPISHFQPLKPHFLTVVSLLLAMCFMNLKGFVYTFTVDVYAFRLAFSSILHCVQHHFTLRLAPKCTAFSTKTHCVQRHIALRLAAKRTSFYYKQPEKWCKWRFWGIYIHFASMYNNPLFSSKPTFARIDFLRQGKRLVNYDGTHNVKKRSKNITKSELIRP